jgi:hypothetical protein
MDICNCPNLGLVHPVAPVFNENHKSIAFVRNLSCLYCTQYHNTICCRNIVISHDIRFSMYLWCVTETYNSNNISSKHDQQHRGRLYYRRVNRTCRLFPQTERWKHIASLHSTRVQLRYTGFLLIFYSFYLVLQILVYNFFYIYIDLAYRTWIVVHLDRRLTDPLSYNNNSSIFIYVIHLRIAV